MNSAFLKLAHQDAALISEIKLAMKELYIQAKRRDIVFVALEHNCAYLA